MVETEKFKQLKNAKNVIVSKIYKIDINPEDIIIQASKVPGVRIDRKQFLKKELTPYYSSEIVKKALAHNPAYAGIKQEAINKIADSVISYETNKVTAISFVAGFPGGLAMAATIPADAIQYFAMMLRTIQKLAYLYGFDDFELNEENIPDETMNTLLIFLGIMFGVQEANMALKFVAEHAAKKVAKNLANKALMKTAYYPIIKKVLAALGIKINKQIFANTTTKVVPVIGAVASGGLSYVTFKPSARKLKNSFKELPLCNPDTYKHEENVTIEE